MSAFFFGSARALHTGIADPLGVRGNSPRRPPVWSRGDTMDRGEDERDALHQVLAVLDGYDDEIQTRILETAACFLGIEVKLGGEAT
jgi:IMP cyclohydrolase